MMAQLADAWRNNPRRFWLYFKGGRRQEFLHDVEARRQYWSALFSDGSDAPQLPRSVRELDKLCAEMVESVSLGRPVRAAGLNKPLALEEVAVVFGKLCKNKAAGPDGLRAEFLRDAVVRVQDDTRQDQPDGSSAVPMYRNVLLPVVHAVLNAVFVSGDYPPTWSLAAVSAIFKKGDPTVQDNYRGIAVGNIFGKLFSMVLEQRLSAWAELLGLRARGQAGFRKGMGTADQLFVLRHILSQHKLSRQPLYMCFVDFRKAYDSVRRDLLLAELAQKGIDGPMLQAVAAMYSSVSRGRSWP
jgi:hypothetical protein